MTQPERSKPSAGKLCALYVGGRAPQSNHTVRYISAEIADARGLASRERVDGIFVDVAHMRDAEASISLLASMAPVVAQVDADRLDGVVALLAAGASEVVDRAGSSQDGVVALRTAIARRGLAKRSGPDVSVTDDSGLTSIAAGIRDGIVITDLDGVVRLVNPVAAKLFGRAEEDMLGSQLGYPIAAGGSELNLLVEIDGELSARTVELHTATIYRGGREECLVVLYDITDRRQAEESLRGLSALAASHELRQPLRAIGGCSRILGKRYASRLDRRGAQLLGHIQDGVKRLDALLNGLLAYTRIGYGGRVRAAIDLKRLVDVVISEFSYDLERVEGRVVRGDLPTLSVDQDQVRILFRNLIGNAIKFRSSSALRVEIGAEQVRDNWEVWVRDNGIGIAEELRGELFVLFRRLHTSEEYEGTGLGLAICRRVVEAHGGRIWVGSPTGPGTEIRFSLSPERRLAGSALGG